MTIFNFFTLLGGIAVFLYGMKVMGDSLEKLAGGKLERLLERLTSNRFKGVALGAGVTAVIQSSSATTVMLVGFVNSGIMALSQAIGVIMGANIGTTATSWILSLSGLSGDNPVVQIFKPDSFAPLLAFIGMLLITISKKSSKHNTGSILVGFGILMTGMMSMQAAVDPLKDEAWFRELIAAMSNPAFGILTGAVLTAIVQSSSASIGIMQAVANSTGTFTYSSALPMIMGQNIGTCATALISSIGTNKNAKRVAVVHLLFNLIGTAVFLSAFYAIDAFVDFTFMEDTISTFGIAIIHSVFNITATIVLIPFTKQLEKLACLIVKDKKEESANEFALLDSRFLSTPSIALEHCYSVSRRMGELAIETFKLSLDNIKNFSPENVQTIMENEEKVDVYDDKIGAYLVHLSSHGLSEKDTQTVTVIQHTISDFERIADHAVNMAESCKEMQKREVTFSDKANDELSVFIGAINEILDKALLCYTENDLEIAKSVEPLEEVIDNLRTELKKRHTKRVRKGKCTIDLGLVLSDMLTNLERVADHCSNIAVNLIQARGENMEAHEYLNELKTDDTNFLVQFSYYTKKYELPKKADKAAQ